MKYILNNKIYDTETSTEILKYRLLLNSSFYNFKTNGIANLILYRSKNNNYFQTAQPEIATDAIYEDCVHLIREITNIEAINIGKQYMSVEKFVSVFGELEEG